MKLVENIFLFRFVAFPQLESIGNKLFSLREWWGKTVGPFIDVQQRQVKQSQRELASTYNQRFLSDADGRRG